MIRDLKDLGNGAGEWGFGVEGLGFRVWGSGLRAQGSRLTASHARGGVWCLIATLIGATATVKMERVLTR